MSVRRAAAVLAATVLVGAGATYAYVADPFTPTTPASTTDNGSATGTEVVQRGDLSGAVVLSLVLLTVSVAILAALRDKWITSG